jgi:hypothetical protein
MPTLKEQQIQGLIEAQIGCEQRDKERALKGITQYIDIGITLMGLERLMDEAEIEDYYTPQFEEES